MMEKILIIVGHPDDQSYNFALAATYERGARKTGAAVTRINIRDLDFNPNLAYGYRKRTELEPDLITAWKLLEEADRLAIFYPVWWGSVPANLKGYPWLNSVRSGWLNWKSWVKRIIAHE